MTLVQRIRKLCKQQGISLFELEDKTGIKHGNIYRWDISVPSVDKVGCVAKCLNTTVDYLIGNDVDGNTVDNIYTKDAAEILRLFDSLGVRERRDLIWYAKALKTKYAPPPSYDVLLAYGANPDSPEFEDVDPYWKDVAVSIYTTHKMIEEQKEDDDNG